MRNCATNSRTLSLTRILKRSWPHTPATPEIRALAADSWIPMDASFKQYDFSEGMNLQAEVPFDAESLVTQIQQSATVNESEGWVQNVPQAAIEQQLNDFRAQLQSYIENQNPDATVGEVLVLQEIKILPPRPLAAGLPYQRILTSQTFADVPNNLRHKFQYTLSTQVQGYEGEQILRIEKPMVKLFSSYLLFLVWSSLFCRVNIFRAKTMAYLLSVLLITVGFSTIDGGFRFRLPKKGIEVGLVVMGVVLLGSELVSDFIL